MEGVIFGGEGFIGRHLAERMIRTGGTAVSVDLAESQRRQGQERTFVAGDVRRPIDLGLAPAEAIYNLAAVHRTPGHPAREYFETNLQGAQNICEYARRTGVRTLVFTSSIAPYGPSEDLKIEETLPQPNSPYGISKLVAEYIHRQWQAEEAGRRRLIIVRPGVVFGQGENGNVTRLYAALRRRRFLYPGRKNTIKASLYVKDAARLLVEMAERPEAGVFLYNLTYEPAPTIQEICHAMSAVTGVSEPRIVVPGQFLELAASALSLVQGFAGEGIHPDRVRKLMISNNISGRRLLEDGYRLEYSLPQAIEDWWNDCEKGPLS